MNTSLIYCSFQNRKWSAPSPGGAKSTTKDASVPPDMNQTSTIKSVLVSVQALYSHQSQNSMFSFPPHSPIATAAASLSNQYDGIGMYQDLLA